MSAPASNMDKAKAAWGDAPPEWIVALARACDGKGLRKTAADIHVSPALVSLIIRNRYAAPPDYLRERVESRLRYEMIPCPVLGLISRADCDKRQAAPLVTASPISVQLYRACRNGCLYNNGKEKEQ